MLFAYFIKKILNFITVNLQKFAQMVLKNLKIYTSSENLHPEILFVSTFCLENVFSTSNP